MAKGLLIGPGQHRHAEDLRWYYCESAAQMGVCSSHAVLVAIASGGLSGFKDHESRITDRKHSFGSAPSPTSKERRIRRVLLELGAAQEEVLRHTFGPLHWIEVLDDKFGKGTLMSLVERYGDLAGVAILTKAVAQGYERDRPHVLKEHEKRYAHLAEAKRPPSEWDSPVGWLVSTCKSGRADEAKKVRNQAETRFGKAFAAYMTIVAREDATEDSAA